MGSFFCFLLIGRQTRSKTLFLATDRLILQFRFPKAVEVAVFIDRNNLLATHAHLSAGLILQVNQSATAAGKLNIDERDMVLREHRVLHAAHLNTQLAVINLLHHGNVFLGACIHGVGNEFFHLLTTAERYHSRIYGCEDHIAALVTFVEFHSCKGFLSVIILFVFHQTVFVVTKIIPPYTKVKLEIFMTP